MGRPQEGHSNPEGQRSFASASAHFSSVPKSLRNIAMLISFWNGTKFNFVMDSPGVFVSKLILYLFCFYYTSYVRLNYTLSE